MFILSLHLVSVVEVLLCFLCASNNNNLLATDFTFDPSCKIVVPLFVFI